MRKNEGQKKSAFKVLLVSLYNDEAYGLRSLQAIIREKGYAVNIVFLKINRKKKGGKQELNVLTERELYLFKKFILKYKPALIAFSLVSSNFAAYKKIYSHIKDLRNFKVMVGGWQASLNPEKTIECCDMLCIGEGEEAVGEAVDCLYRKNGLENVRNLWVKNGEKIIKNSVRPLIEDFDKIPNALFLDSEAYYIENDELINSDPYTDNTRYGIIMGRGCPFACTYCSNSYMASQVYQKSWSSVRYRSIEHVLDELHTVKKYLTKVQRINFYDEVFLVKGQYSRNFFERYKREIGLPFYCMFYPGTCSEESVKLLKDAGLSGVWLGVQSGSDRVRKEIFKRYYTNDVIKKQGELFHKYGISVRYDFIFDNPFELPEETEESIKLMQELPTPFSVNLFSLKFFPNTEITKMALCSGLIAQSRLDDQLSVDHHTYLVSDEMKSEIKKRVGKEEVVIT